MVRGGTMQRDDAQIAILSLLEMRDPDKTICPSEAARALAKARGAPDDWRADMASAHAAARKLAQEGMVTPMQGGKAVAAPEGAYRIARADP